jgi:mono/diheme cytochrome c family protein
VRRATTAILFAILAAVALAGGPRSVEIPPNPQTLGDPDAGLRYLLHGGYVGSGIPIDLWRAVSGGDRPTPVLDRQGVDPTVPHTMNQFVTPDGAEVVGGVNCLACHASRFRGEFVIGMGNSLSDWTGDGPDPSRLGMLGAISLPPDSPEMDALRRFLRGAAALRGKTGAPFRGVNPAFRIEEVAAAQREPETLAWTDTPVFTIGDRVVASDVPPWWNVKKKHALYYNGMGRGDFARLLQQIGVVMIDDAEQAETITPGMRDLLAYIHTLEPPVYPGPIDPALAARGQRVFADHCATCHGTYGEQWTYPNKLVPLERVGTDPLYVQALRESGLHDWYNRSWFATTPGEDEPGSYVEPVLGYVAPPLDGVWATAPYLHNGSVPTLDAVLDSSRRPERWRRSFRDDDYDLDRLGWRHTVPDENAPANDPNVYDTRLEGYGNQGHTFGDDLSDDDRRALLEYLKTL